MLPALPCVERILLPPSEPMILTCVLCQAIIREGGESACHRASEQLNRQPRPAQSRWRGGGEKWSRGQAALARLELSMTPLCSPAVPTQQSCE